MNKDELERRVDAATSAANDILDDEFLVDSEMEHVLKAAFPELFTDPPSMWLAPMEATDRMAYQGEGYSDFCDTPGVIEGHDQRIQEVRMIYGAMRDAFMQGNKPSTGDGG